MVGLAFLLGAPVFVAMAALAMALFFRDAGPEAIAAVPTATFNLRLLGDAARDPAPHRRRLRAGRGRRGERLVRAYKGVFGWMPGGVAVMATFVCALFTTFTGASGVTILALGGLLLPALLEDGYPEDFSVGLVTAAGLARPALPALAPGDPLRAWWRRRRSTTSSSADWSRAADDRCWSPAYGVGWASEPRAAPGVRTRGRRSRRCGTRSGTSALPTLVVVAVGSGFATVVEAAALAAAYSLVVELLVFRSIHPVRDLPRVLVHAVGAGRAAW